MIAPRAIKKLDETVVNRIAAGEVVQRPSAAIKEMLENSLDAGASSISVTVKGGGLQLLMIQDNGSGIKKEDLGIVCERFTTSKLSTFEDLKTISTFGFRGEALASITHVSHLTITTRTADAPCAYKAKYTDGQLPCAGTVGTTIAVEDLFYNMNTRRTAFKNLNEQYQRVLDVVTKYSIHYSVSFTCKRHGQELLDLEFSENAMSSQQSPSDFERCEFSVRGKISNANYSSKRGMFIIFINNRLVESASVKRVVESLYVDLLPKHSHPFAYLSIEMPLSHVDVNVHPTKKEVHFLHETELLERLHKEITKLLSGASNSRTFYAKPLLPQNGESVGLNSHAAAVGRGTMEISMESSSQSTSRSRIVESNQVEESPQASIDSTTARRPKPPAQKQTSLIDAATVQDTKISSSKTRSSIDAKRLVRVDSSEHEQEREQAEEDSSDETDSSNNNPSSLETFQNKGNQTNASKSSLSFSSTTTPSNPLSLTFKFTETPINYDSIHGMLAEINNGYNATLQKAISQHVVVGVVSQRWSAVQCGTRLLLLDHCRLSEHLFYQLSIRRFAVMPTIPLVNHVPVYSYILAALDQPEADWKLEDGSKLEIAGRATKLLREKAGLLKEYFSIGIEESSSANDEEDASNAEEQGCFRTIACNIAMYYARQASDEAEMTSQYNVSDVVKTTLVNILLPAIRSQLKLPSECATDGTVVQIAALEQLYKVFERC
eukprot:GSChrysophyteH1.ASY1.ANO1.1976.1 assembled CDS